MRQFRFIIIFAVLCVSIAASAQDSTPKIGTAQENTCNEGGLFFRDGVSLCETEWHWECGWYIANWQNTSAPIPDWCGVSATAPMERCFHFTSIAYVRFIGSFVMSPGATLYSDPACTIETGNTTPHMLIYSELPSTEVRDMCFFDFLRTGFATTQTPNLYRCYYV